MLLLAAAPPPRPAPLPRFSPHLRTLTPPPSPPLAHPMHAQCAVKDCQRFTLYWLECSLEYGSPLPSMARAPLYHPLPYTLPLPGMDSVM